MNALVDTGATRTCVTAEIARKAGLRVMGKTPISSVHGTEDANVYVADILLFVDLRLCDFRMTKKHEFILSH
ncbi:MAG: aspartyl protease family protein [Deltaproteobacteria bacterium]|nr:aspartyl protease family protein [Deltaproteobacteria bacterium]